MIRGTVFQQAVMGTGLAAIALTEYIAPRMDRLVVSVFLIVYLGMMFGRFPGLALDRTGVALLGAIVLLAIGRVSPQAARDAVDIPTIGLLFGLMVVSAQFRLGGFYAHLTRRITTVEASPALLLAIVILVAGALSALLVNDIVVLAITPILIQACARRGLNPVPFLLGLACAANVGSAATLVGNPQNILIGQWLKLSFVTYLWYAGVPSLVGLVLVWLVICFFARKQWHRETVVPHAPTPELNRWQTSKGLLTLTILVAAFLFAPWPREVLALTAAGALMTSRRLHSREMLGLVDWQLLVLFVSLFIVNHAAAESGLSQSMLTSLADRGVPLHEPQWLFPVSVVLSNIVSNVPAVMLLLPSATHPLAGPVLALGSTLAGNLFIVGSIANIIVVDQAAQLDVRISWWDHAKIGIPVTLLTLAVAAGWLWCVG